MQAEYLYTLPQWEGIFSPEKRKIQKQYRSSVIVRNENKIDRNDPCPCEPVSIKSVVENKFIFIF